MAKVLETQFSKQEILEIYLNQMYFGLGAYGIGAAAQAYFKKSATHLTLAESAYLAGLLKAPSRLSRDPQRARKRQQLVLRRMNQVGFIDHNTYVKTKNQSLAPLTDRLPRVKIAPYFVDAVHYELKQYYDSKNLDSSLRIHSSYDPAWQHKLQKAMKAQWYFLLEKTSQSDDFGEKVEMAGLVYNFHHHHIIALKGGKNYKTSEFNRAFYTLRAMDHTILPFLGILLKNQGHLFHSYYSRAHPRNSGTGFAKSRSFFTRFCIKTIRFWFSVSALSMERSSAEKKR